MNIMLPKPSFLKLAIITTIGKNIKKPQATTMRYTSWLVKGWSWTGWKICCWNNALKCLLLAALLMLVKGPIHKHWSNRKTELIETLNQLNNLWWLYSLMWNQPSYLKNWRAKLPKHWSLLQFLANCGLLLLCWSHCCFCTIWKILNDEPS